MASSFVLNRADVFPNGTSVGAYPLTNWPGGRVNEAANPLGSATNSQTMTAGTLTFTGLTEGVPYVAYATVSSVRYWIYFQVSDVSNTGPITSSIIDTDATLAGNSDTRIASQKAVKSYVDAVASGLEVKQSVRVATTANGTLASAFENGDTVDGVVLATGNRILLKDQSTGSQNGIYVVAASGAPTRATDFDTATEVTGGAFTFVEEGTANADSGWVLTNDGAVVIGTTALVFSQFSGAGQVTAGDGLTKTGNTLNVVPGAGLVVAADSVSPDFGTASGKVAQGNDSRFPAGADIVIGDLSSFPSVGLRKAAAQSLGNGTIDALTWDTEDWDTDGMHEGVTNPTRITIVTAGVYRVDGNLAWATNATGLRIFYLYINGAETFVVTPPAAIGGWQTHVAISVQLKLAATDYLELKAYQSSGGALNTVPLATRFTASWVAKGT